MADLHAGRTQAAWDLLLSRYRGLILATIRRLVREDDVMDVFASTCEALAANEFARLRTYGAISEPAASFPTWLVAVVRNVAVDWLRRTEGRRRIVVPQRVSPLQREIFRAVCVDGASHVEAFEIIRSRSAPGLTFADFLRELRDLNRSAPCPNGIRAVASHQEMTVERESGAPSPIDDLAAVDAARRITAALATLPADVQVAVQLFVVEGLSAREVSLIVGWPNEKAVYNRVSRALGALRRALEKEGITRAGDVL